MSWNSVVLASVATFLIAGSALAQSGSVTDADKSFLTKDSRGAAYELESAKLAVSKATREDVKSYAQKLVQDHGKYNAELAQLGKTLGLTLPTEPDQVDAAHLVDLKRLSGPAFDTLFIKESQRVNADDKQEAEKEKSATHNEAIKSFIGKFAATDAEHEKLANQLARSSS